MNNEKLIQQLDEFMALNRRCRQDGNDLLNELRGILTKNDPDEYNRGLNDAWELAQRIGGVKKSDAYHVWELEEIFGTAYVFDDFTFQQALEKVEAYEKKKAEEETKLEPGDVVTVDSMTYGSYKGIIEKVDGENIAMLTRYGRLSFNSSQKQQFNIRKTGERLDNYLELFDIFYGKMERTNND